jgi:hypothetical protein
MKGSRVLPRPLNLPPRKPGGNEIIPKSGKPGWGKEIEGEDSLVKIMFCNRTYTYISP